MTKFSVGCIDWKIWRPSSPDSRLQYESSIRQKGSSRSFLVTFGYEPTSQPVVFPVGTISAGFALDVLVKVFDDLGDFYQLEKTVRVSTL